MTTSRSQAAVLRADLPSFAKKLAWEVKYRVLGYNQVGAAQDVVDWISERTPPIANLIELGCGRASLLRGLRATGWAGYYCGVDISKKAIKDAAKLNDQRSSFVASDFESFRSPFKWEVIAMVESVYYVKLAAIPQFVAKLQDMLCDSGVLLVRIHDTSKHRAYLDALEQQMTMIGEGAANVFCFGKRLDRMVSFPSKEPQTIAN